MADPHLPPQQNINKKHTVDLNRWDEGCNRTQETTLSALSFVSSQCNLVCTGNQTSLTSCSIFMMVMKNISDNIIITSINVCMTLVCHLKRMRLLQKWITIRYYENVKLFVFCFESKDVKSSRKRHKRRNTPDLSLSSQSSSSSSSSSTAPASG